VLTWIWNQIEVSLPEDWEMLQLARDRTRGRCGFADRYRYRFELNWSARPGQPDFDRMLTDYECKLVQEGRMTHTRQVQQCGFRGLIGQSPEGTVSRFGTWIASQQRLVEVVFLWHGDRSVPLEKDVMASLRPCPVHTNGLVRWRAFGLEVCVPDAFSLESCSSFPASTGYLFRGRSPLETWVFRRHGLVDNWLRTDLTTWLKSQVPGDVRNLAAHQAVEAGILRTRIDGAFRPRGPFRRHGVFHAVAWRQTEDQRLYLAMLINPARSSLADKDPLDFIRPAPEFTFIPN